MSIAGICKTGLTLSLLIIISFEARGGPAGDPVSRQPTQEATVSQSQEASATQPAAPPRLAVLIIIDQFRYDFLQRFEDLYVEDGFRRFMDHGAWMQDARFSHVHASTSPGHSVITSGTYAHKTGMVNNWWYNRSRGVFQPSLVDPESHILGKEPTENGRASTRQLKGSSLADELRMATRYRGKAISISLKDYSAMISAGKLGAPYWFEASLGRITSSSYFMDDLPGWVKRFNDRKLPDQSFGRKWERLMPEQLYLDRAGPGDHLPSRDERRAGSTRPALLERFQAYSLVHGLPVGILPAGDHRGRTRAGRHTGRPGHLPFGQ